MLAEGIAGNQVCSCIGILCLFDLVSYYQYFYGILPVILTSCSHPRAVASLGNRELVSLLETQPCRQLYDDHGSVSRPRIGTTQAECAQIWVTIPVVNKSFQKSYSGILEYYIVRNSGVGDPIHVINLIEACLLIIPLLNKTARLSISPRTYELYLNMEWILSQPTLIYTQ